MSTTPPLIIGLTGLAGSGKDTARQILEAHHGFDGLAFADPIRAMLRPLLQMAAGAHDADRFMTDRALKETAIPGVGHSYRELAQTLGTEWGRMCLAPDIWLRIAGARIAQWVADDEQDRQDTFDIDATGTRVVISDVRFVNEAAWVLSQGGHIWHIRRPAIEPVRMHVSEDGVAAILAKFRAAVTEVRNDGTIDQLQDRIASLMADLAPVKAGAA
jgi:hypothetical protein